LRRSRQLASKAAPIPINRNGASAMTQRDECVQQMKSQLDGLDAKMADVAAKATDAKRTGLSNALFPSPWHPESDKARRLVRFNLFSEAAAVCCALTPPPTIGLRGRRLRVVPGLQVTSTDPINLFFSAA
jgi:hypothetical protein